jgi:hypothetical protein
MQGSLWFQPNKFVFKGAVSVQADTPIGRRILVDSEIVATRRKLPASRWRGDNFHSAMVSVVRLMHVTEDRKPYFP